MPLLIISFTLSETGTFTWTAKKEICSDIEQDVLSDEASCRIAASSRSLAFKGSVNYSRLPAGCFQVVNVFWNTNEDGKRSSLTKAICKERGKSITYCDTRVIPSEILIIINMHFFYYM